MEKPVKIKEYIEETEKMLKDLEDYYFSNKHDNFKILKTYEEIGKRRLNIGNWLEQGKTEEDNLP